MGKGYQTGYALLSRERLCVPCNPEIHTADTRTMEPLQHRIQSKAGLMCDETQSYRRRELATWQLGNNVYFLFQILAQTFFIV